MTGMRRAGAGVVGLVGVWTAVTLVGDGTWALLGDGLRAMLGEGSPSTIGDTLRVVLADGLPALVLALGLVPAVALVLATAVHATRRAVGVVAAGLALLALGVVVLAVDPSAVRLATASWYFAVGSPRMLAGVWLVVVGGGVSAAGAGVLLRRRGAVVAGAALVAVGALGTTLAAGASMALTVTGARAVPRWTDVGDRGAAGRLAGGRARRRHGRAGRRVVRGRGMAAPRGLGPRRRPTGRRARRDDGWSPGGQSACWWWASAPASRLGSRCGSWCRTWWPTRCSRRAWSARSGAGRSLPTSWTRCT